MNAPEPITRQKFIDTARKYTGVKFAHQGRNPKFGIDCGGLILVVGRELELTQLEELGYASYPTNGRFEELLNSHTENLNFESKYPHYFTGLELLPGDLLSFDYNNGEGTRHIALVTKWDSRNYWIIDASPGYGISEKPLRHPFNLATVKGWRVRGLVD